MFFHDPLRVEEAGSAVKLKQTVGSAAAFIPLGGTQSLAGANRIFPTAMIAAASQSSASG